MMELTSRVIGTLNSLASRYNFGTSFSSIFGEYMFTSMSVSAFVAYSLTGSGDNNGVASTIADDRQVASIQDKASPLVLLNKLPDWLASLRMDALLPLFFHGNLRDFFELWWDQSLAG